MWCVPLYFGDIALINLLGVAKTSLLSTNCHTFESGGTLRKPRQLWNIFTKTSEHHCARKRFRSVLQGLKLAPLSVREARTFIGILEQNCCSIGLKGFSCCGSGMLSGSRLHGWMGPSGGSFRTSNGEQILGADPEKPAGGIVYLTWPGNTSGTSRWVERKYLSLVICSPSILLTSNIIFQPLKNVII